MDAPVKLVSAQNHIRYSVGDTSSGSDTEDLTQAALVADLAKGPLRAFLEGITTDAAWAALDSDARISVYIAGRASVTGGNITYSWTTAGVGNRVLRIGTAAGFGGTYVFEVVFHHSMVR